jgi:phosphatidylinositol alpha-1,6-mannosyltransferase
VILTVARLEQRKGIDMVIRALPAVLKTHANATYIVAGDGSDSARLKGLAEGIGVADRVTFVGPVDGDIKAAYFAAADVFAMPSRRIGNSVESFGIAYLEAGWYGVPSLAGNDGGAADAVSDGETGLICDGGNPDSVAETLLTLLDGARRRPLGAAARARARGPAQWASTLSAYLAALR